MSGESGGVVRNADHQGAAIFMDIVNSIWNGDADGIGAEVVVEDAARSAFPTTARVLEVTHQFALLAVHADDRQAQNQPISRCAFPGYSSVLSLAKLANSPILQPRCLMPTRN